MHRSKLAFCTLAALVVAAAARQACAQTFTTLYSFDNAHGKYPQGDLTQIGSNLYGMTWLGGPNDNGEIFRIPVTGGTPTVLTSFGTTAGGPEGDLTLSANGSTFYAMTESGQAGTHGAVISVPVTGGAPTILTYFNGTNGASVQGNVILSPNGSTLYGMTAGGGTNNEGTIFSESVAGGAPTTLFSFDDTHGAYPYGSLTLSADGSTLYGLTNQGGAFGFGTIFTEPVGGGTPTVLYSFDGGQRGGYPDGSLILSGSTLYGETQIGGAYSDGTVFSFPLTGGTPTVLASFNGTDGDVPLHSLALSGSTLYGMTINGGAFNDGTVFSVPLAGGIPTVLHSFDGTDGLNPHGSVIVSGSTLYGMTYQGGTSGDGTIFSLVLTPEPSSLVLLGVGTLALGAITLRRGTRRQAA